RESGWTVTERRDPTKQVPIEPRHVCLLFRRFRSFAKDVTRPYVRALESRRLPHLLVGGSGFREASRPAVRADRCAVARLSKQALDASFVRATRGRFT